MVNATNLQETFSSFKIGSEEQAMLVLACLVHKIFSLRKMTLFCMLLCDVFFTAVGAEIVSVHILSSKANAYVGETLVINCKFQETDVIIQSAFRIHWQKKNKDTFIVVHSYYDGDDRLQDQELDYQDRTQLFHSEFQHGNVSLMLSRVKLSDSGLYRCVVADQMGLYFDEGTLKVHAKNNAPVITVLEGGGKFGLNCETTRRDHKAEITWSYGKAVRAEEIGVKAHSIMSTGHFAVQSSLLLEDSTQEKVCCLAGSTDTEELLETCMVIQGNNSQDLETQCPAIWIWLIIMCIVSVISITVNIIQYVKAVSAVKRTNLHIDRRYTSNPMHYNLVLHVVTLFIKSYFM
ncbi:CD276 antigen homolog [Protopterus annectens]|uniref:CD276 antigen homolog n=1 Tax=Protopterus annectens TaxID=7888 RepID=UPI001CFB5B5E|nr:CD276 antigen homolog [Protopterus annectens]